MKKIERLHHEERNGDYRREISSIDSIIDTVNSLVDSNNELLETHTVKEEEKDNYGKCSCDEKGICKKLGDVIKLILEVHWPEDVKLKEMDKLITEHYHTPPSNTVKEEKICPYKEIYELDGCKCKEEPTTTEEKTHTKPMKKCKICKMDYCPECFEFCPMCPRPSLSKCHQGESEKRNDVY